MEKVLITGGMGFLGSHLCKRLLDMGHEVWALDLFDPPFAQHLRTYDRFHLVVDTIKNRPLLEKLVNKCDIICHLAAIASPGQYVTHPRKVMDITLLSGLELVELVRLTGKLLFFTSTSEIYGRSPKVPFAEGDDRLLGGIDVNRWCYSTSKAAIEHYIRACHQDAQLDYITVRIFNCYGPRLRGRVVDAFVDSALTGEELVVHGEGSQTRCFTYVDDVIDAFVRLIKDPSTHNQEYNVGNPTETTVLELAQRVADLTDISRERISFHQHKAMLGASYEDVQRRVPDITRLHEAIGWTPTTSLDEGLAKMIAYRQEELARGQARHPPRSSSTKMS